MNHRQARAALVLLVAAYLAWPLLRGHVLFPHDNALEVGLPPEPASPWVSNRKFSDLNLVYLPALDHQLRSDSAGWIPTWNPWPELGRPESHVTGLSKAYFLTHLFSLASDDALAVSTWLASAALFLCALFGYLLLEELGLRPVACLVGALGLSLGIFNAYWLTFALFLWSIAWTLAILWLVARAPRRFGAAEGLGLAFAVHALCLSGYPQQTVWHGYLVLGFALERVLRRRAEWRARLRLAGALAGAGALGVLSAAPAWLDLARDAALSARLEVDARFYLAVLPEIDGWRGLCTWASQLYDAFWPGNPILSAPLYPLHFSGVSLGPVYASLAAASLLLARRLWPVQLFALVALVMTVWPPLYAFGVRHAFLDVSRFTPLAGAIVPLYVLAAYALDAALRDTLGAPLVRTAAGLAPALVAGLGMAVADCAPSPLALAGLAALGGTLVFLWTGSWPWIAATAAASVLFLASELRLARPPESVRLSSPLVEALQAGLGGPARYALVETRPELARAGNGAGMLLPSNEETLHRTPSIHTYNSLSSRRYQAWAEGLSTARTQEQGRYFRHLLAGPELRWDALQRAGVALLLPLGGGWRPDAARCTPVPGTPFFRPALPPLLEAQLEDFELVGQEARVAWGGAGLAVERTLQRDDRLRFQVTPSERPTLLFVSQAWHPRWRASDGQRALDTAPVDGVYLGVVLPPGTREVELRFLPAVRWAWLPQLAFAGLAGLFALRRAARRGERAPKATAGRASPGGTGEARSPREP